MKSWKNRRNTIWILIATAFGLVFPGNQASHYRNFVGLVFCWALYWFCFFRNNREVEEQEQREEEERQERIKQELEKREKERIKKEEKEKEFYELVECPKIIRYILDKYNRDWEKDLYPRDARYHINDIKRKIKSDIEFEEMTIRNNKNAIEGIEDLKKKTRFRYKCEELNRRIDAYQSDINRRQEHIKDIPKRYEQRISFYQDQIERYKDQCREHEQRANELLLNSPEEIIRAVDCHLRKIEQVRNKPVENSRYGSNEPWIKREEEKIPYLLQAKLDAIDRIQKMKEEKSN